MKWRLGIDLGTNSLGWAALELAQVDKAWTPVGLIDCGARIFSDGRNPKDKQSNAVKRREPRGARRNRDRYLRRRDRLMRQLIQYGLMPDTEVERKALEGSKGMDLTHSDPWILRARALQEPITLHQLGRVIFHLHQRRGFKSNRKTDRGDNESGKVHDATRRTRDRLEAEGARTLGELFGKPRLETLRHNQTAARGAGLPQPLARVRKSGDGSKWQYDYYPTRALILDEFDQIWASQLAYHSTALTNEARDTLRNTIEWQHPLKSPDVGRCTLLPELPRAPKALPSSQRARIFQEVNALRVGRTGETKIPLTPEQRDTVADRLLHPTNKTADVSFDQIRKLLALSSYDRFNTESEKRNKLKGDETAARLMQKDRWGSCWFDLSLATRDMVVTQLLEEENEENLFAWLLKQHDFDRQQAIRIADCPLPDGYGNLSEKALALLLPHLETDVHVYSDAVKAAGLHHSQFGSGEIFENGLPYYGRILERSVAFGSGKAEDTDEKRYGKVANPTVHVALNQVRAVINDLIGRFGTPEQIVLELARDLPLSARGKSELESKQRDNQLENERRSKQLEGLGVANTYENRLKLRLYEDLEALGKRCVFSGDQIALSMLFTDQIEIEHILPFSKTLDDSFSNKTLATRMANRDKQNRSPYEAFGHSPAGYDWSELAKRANELPVSKKWRFGPDAMERYENEERNFLSRQLTDTQYIARLAKAYVEAIYGGQGHAGSENHVWVITGRLTSDLRHHWGLDSILRGHNEPISEAQKKNRDDHRHHAIDAVVIACTDRAMLKAAADEAHRQEEAFNARLLAGIPEPWANFRDHVAQKVRDVVISQKPDHGFQGAMHNDTAYGIVKGVNEEPDRKGVRTVVTRKPLDSEAFKSPADLQKIRDFPTMMALLEATQGLKGTEFKSALLATARAMTPPVRKVRIEEKLNVIAFEDKQGKIYKGYKGDGNYCYDIWVDPKGKWTGEVVSTFQAYQLARDDKDWWTKQTGRAGQPLAMRIRKGDMVKVIVDGKPLILTVYKFSEGKLNMAEHNEANASARIREKTLNGFQMSPSSLQKADAKRVTVSPSGMVKIYQ
ncbi:MAG: type II CRISPR RNA-guided endonuclease Cas9 [Rhizobiaceae bacterium]|nr:type II CRISPR RNA-guided endonuclease Cas9 [Rhizobiaceae bacterium]